MKITINKKTLRGMTMHRKWYFRFMFIYLKYEFSRKGGFRKLEIGFEFIPNDDNNEQS